MSKEMLKEEMKHELDRRYRIAESALDKWSSNDIGGKDLIKLDSINPKRARRVALGISLQENYIKRNWKQLNEALTSSNFTTTPEQVLKIVKLGLANSCRGDIVVEYPLTAPDDALYYIYMSREQTLRDATAGERIFENVRRFYAGETQSQTLGTGNGVTTAFSATLAMTPVVPFHVRIVSGEEYIGIDNGAGVIVGPKLSGTNTINYSTGAITVTFTSAPASGAAVVCEFNWDSEASGNFASFGTVGINVAKIRFKARPVPLGYRFSDMAALTLETTGLGNMGEMLIEAVGSEHAKTRDFRCVAYLRQIAKRYTTETFDADFASVGEVSAKSHAQNIMSKIQDIGGTIYDSIQRGQINIAVAGSKALTYLKKHDLWKTDTGGYVEQGVYQAGYLDTIKVFTCPAETNVIANNEVILSYKNPNESEDIGVAYGNLTELRAELRYPQFYTEGNLATVEDRVLIEPQFFKLLQITNL